MPEQVREAKSNTLNEYANMADGLADWQESAASATYSQLRPVENAVGKIIIESIENGGFTLESGLISTLAYAFGGPLGGLAARLYNTTAEAETEAGHVYMEAFRRELDHGLNPDQAKWAAYERATRTRDKNLILLSATNSVGDFLLYDASGFFKNFAESVIPGGGWVSKIARGALRVGLPAVLDATTEGFEEYMQEWSQMYDLGDQIDERQLLEAFKMGFWDSMLYSASGGVIRGAANLTPGARRNARIQSIIDNNVRDLYTLEEKSSNGGVNADAIIEQEPIVFLPKSRIDEQAAQALGLQSEVMEDEEGNVVEERLVGDEEQGEEQAVTETVDKSR